jgi:surface polysaccharide O-acyltransferase-like enzyme
MPSAVKKPIHTRIYAIDFARVVVISNVVAVHVLAQLQTTVAVGAIGMMMHVNRELFLMISGLVLSFSYGLRPQVNWRAFFRRRYMLILVPFVTWTVIYSLTSAEFGRHLGKDLVLVGGFLVTGRASYHLYFMLILLQLYLVFPLLRRFMNATRGRHLRMLAIAGIWQLVFSAIVQRSWGQFGPLGWWLGNPDPWIFSYIFYILAGAAAAWHLPELITFVQVNFRRVMFSAGLVALLGLGVYFAQLPFMPIDSASTTFQPMIVIESVAFGLAILALGSKWEYAGMPLRRGVLYGSVASFGLFLAHPLVIWELQHVLGFPLPPAILQLPEFWRIIVTMGVGAPLVVAISLGLAEAVVRTPLSLPLAGRPRNVPIPLPENARPDQNVHDARASKGGI